MRQSDDMTPCQKFYPQIFLLRVRDGSAGKGHKTRRLCRHIPAAAAVHCAWFLIGLTGQPTTGIILAPLDTTNDALAYLVALLDLPLILISILTLWHHNRFLALSWVDVFDWLNGDGTEGHPLCRWVTSLIFRHHCACVGWYHLLRPWFEHAWSTKGLLAIFKAAGSPSNSSIDVRESFFCGFAKGL